MYLKYSTWPPWYELMAMPCTSSCSAAVHDLVDRAVVAEVDHLRAHALQDAAHDVDGRVVAVEQARRGDESNLVRGPERGQRLIVGRQLGHDEFLGDFEAGKSFGSPGRVAQLQAASVLPSPPCAIIRLRCVFESAGTIIHGAARRTGGARSACAVRGLERAPIACASSRSPSANFQCLVGVVDALPAGAGAALRSR